MGFIEICVKVFCLVLMILSISVSLEAGYLDFFNLDLGWQVSGAAPDGIWERGVPIGTQLVEVYLIQMWMHQIAENKAYVTGNGGGSAGFG